MENSKISEIIINLTNEITRHMSQEQINLVISVFVFIIVIAIYRHITKEERIFHKRMKKHWILKKRVG